MLNGPESGGFQSVTAAWSSIGAGSVGIGTFILWVREEAGRWRRAQGQVSMTFPP